MLVVRTHLDQVPAVEYLSIEREREREREGLPVVYFLISYEKVA